MLLPVPSPSCTIFPDCPHLVGGPIYSAQKFLEFGPERWLPTLQAFLLDVRFICGNQHRAEITTGAQHSPASLLTGILGQEGRGTGTVRQATGAWVGPKQGSDMSIKLHDWRLASGTGFSVLQLHLSHGACLRGCGVETCNLGRLKPEAHA